MNVLRELSNRSVLFWDFDGVIKESVDVKTRAYVELFRPFGEDVSERVREHHEGHGGMSRLEKIPLYLAWAGEAATDLQVTRYCARFASLVQDAVIESPWVPGAREYIEAHFDRQRFVLITGTPQAEIETILQATGIARCFREVHGAPTAKAGAIASVLERWRCARSEAIVLGDSGTDQAAALCTGLDFLLRRTPQNATMQKAHAGLQCEDFLHE
jgi:phosphoglycolate phosphatase-like HAD superfamily hydrolase